MFLFISVSVKRYGNRYGYVEIPSSMLKYLAKDYDGVIKILEEEKLIKESSHGRNRKTGISRSNSFGLVEEVGYGGKLTDFMIPLSEKGLKEFSDFLFSLYDNNINNYNIKGLAKDRKSIISVEAFSYNNLSDKQLNDILESPFEERYRYLEYQDSKGRMYDSIPAKHETADSRYFHWLHSMPSKNRKYVYFNGSPLVENFDVTGCFYTLIARLMMNQGNIPVDEMDRYRDLVKNGDIYNSIKDWIKREINYPYSRDQVKKMLQSWRNTLSTRMKASESRDSLFRDITKWWDANYPHIGNAIINYPTYRNKEKKKTKRLQLDCCSLETRYISGAVCSELAEKYKVAAFTVHDAVYVTESDKEKLDNLGVKIEDIFWKVIGI